MALTVTKAQWQDPLHKYCTMTPECSASGLQNMQIEARGEGRKRFSSHLVLFGPFPLDFCIAIEVTKVPKLDTLFFSF